MQKEYQQRRKALMRQIGRGNIALIASASNQTRNNDVEFPFRQESDFHYLTGFDEPEAVALFIPGRKKGEYILFCREYDKQKALWTGEYAGLDSARADYRADQALAIDQLDERLPALLANRQRLFYPVGRDPALDQRLLGLIGQLRGKSRAGLTAPFELLSLEQLLDPMRLIKSEREIGLMRAAARVSVQAHIRAMKACRPGRYEYQIEAELVHEFMRNGMRSPAYASIVAGGNNACVLHYTENSDLLRAGDLILIDAGAEHRYYAADITRTFPVSGRFSKPQRALYQLVLKAQQAAIEQVRPGVRWNAIHQAAVRVITEGLVELGLLEGKVSKLIKKGKYRRFFMHKTGHWLGMDVHDVGSYMDGKKWRRLAPGMVLTVEPGLYIPRNCKKVAKKWRGIGIRIEDDLLVTSRGHEILTEGAPKSVSAIEQLMRS